jgi:double-stranded uracil-DNA glycosylase
MHAAHDTGMQLPGPEARAVDLAVALEEVPLALADLHASLAVGVAVNLDLPPAPVDRVTDLVVGAGFTLRTVDAPPRGRVQAEVVRARTLPDTVATGMRLLVCGLNPSVYSADAGIGFARPGNRYWPAALAAGIVSRDRDARHALTAHGVGMTDLVKRATPRADELTRDEYRDGAARVERLVRWLAPGAICFVGLAGWRAAVDRRAQPGVQEAPFGGRPAYVMPSTSGLNARVPPAELADHLRAAFALGAGEQERLSR